jgi:hypothetical protein
VSQDDTNALSARHGEEYAICTKAAVLDLLRRSGVDAAAFACAWAVADDHVPLADDRLPLADDDLDD